ncbi:unnamed protein product, partial [Closterium sp. NIES-54]
ISSLRPSHSDPTKFYLATSARTLILCAESAEDRSLWLQAIEAARLSFPVPAGLAAAAEPISPALSSLGIAFLSPMPPPALAAAATPIATGATDSDDVSNGHGDVDVDVVRGGGSAAGGGAGAFGGEAGKGAAYIEDAAAGGTVRSVHVYACMWSGAYS